MPAPDSTGKGLQGSWGGSLRTLQCAVTEGWYAGKGVTDTYSGPHPTPVVRKQRRDGRAGFTLLEALIALTVLGLAGTAMVEVAGQAARTAARAAQEEHAVQDMDRLLTAYALLDRRDLERRLGTELVGSYAVSIGRFDEGLYTVTVGRQNAPSDLATVLYRPGRAL